jgi:single-stranded-DNA-specific exonuclease
LNGLVRPVNPGLRALLKLAAPGKDRVKADDIAFRIAPRINAAGRMGGAGTVVELFTANEAQAAVLAAGLEQMNQQRREAVEHMLLDIDAQLTAQSQRTADAILVLDGEGWHRGVLGIVASRVQHKFGKPVLIIGRENGMAHGSGRAPEGIHLLELLETCPELFERFGGHAQAVGFSLPCDRIEALRQRLNEAAGRQERAPAAAPCADIELRLGEIQQGLLDDLERLEPCGHGNPIPVFLARGVRLAGDPIILKEKHLKLRVEQDGQCFEALAWNVCGDGAEHRNGRPDPEAMTAGSMLDIVFRIEVSEHPQFGKRTQLILNDYRLAGEVG